MSIGTFIGLALTVAVSSPSSDAAITSPPHGGILASAGAGKLELVLGPERLALYPLDARLRAAPVGNTEALLIGADGVPVPLSPATDHWEAANPYGTDGSEKSLTVVALVRSPAGVTAARFELRPGQGSMYHDHRPFHGGQVGMAGDRHLELALVRTEGGEELQLYLTDAYRQPESLDGVRGFLTLQQGERSTTAPLVPAGECFTVSKGKSKGPLVVHVHLEYPGPRPPARTPQPPAPVAFTSAPDEVDMDFYFEQSVATAIAERPVKILVNGSGFSPNRVEAPAGRPLTLRFFRTTNDTCAKQVVFPSMGLQRELPLQRDVDVALVPTQGEIAFSCAMGMLKGAVVGR